MVGLALLLAAACDDDIFCTPVLETEGGQVELVDATLVHGACRRLREPAPLLVGTRWCPVLSCDSGQPGCMVDEEHELDPGDVAACFEHQVQGATWDAGCLVPDAPGQLEWSFVPRECPANALGYEPQADALVLPVVEPAEVMAWLDVPGDAFARRSLVAEDGEPLPESLQRTPGAVAWVLAGAPIELAVVLTHADLGNVAWNPGQWAVRAEVEGMERAVSLEPLGLVTVTVAAGERMQLWLEREGDALALGEVEGVSAEAITRLEVVPGYTHQDGEVGVPFGARAVTWAGDRIVYGLAPDWTVTEGVLPLWRDPQRPWSPDYVALVDEQGRRCHPLPEREATTFRARLRATVGALEDEATLVWTEQPEAQPDDQSVGEEVLDRLGGDDFERSPLCEGPGFEVQGCGCRGGGSGPGGPGVLALLVLALRRRGSARGRRSTSGARSGRAGPG